LPRKRPPPASPGRFKGFQLKIDLKRNTSGTKGRHVYPKSHPAVVHLGVEAGPLVLQHGQVLLSLGGTGSGLLSSAGQQHGLSLIQQMVVLVGSLSQLGLKLLQRERTQI